MDRDELIKECEKRHKRQNWILAIATTLVIAIIAFVACWCDTREASADLPRMDSLAATFTAEGDVIKLYVIIDPDSGVEYLVSDHGGITPRIKNQIVSKSQLFGQSINSPEYYEYW